ncbi:MAG: sigma-70 family RNA polymerase sigma factor [Phycisphaerales bacterium]|nr:sigma-70 family RNA polymerase sigma factor [Planctomycetota bacterium]MCH8508077.1 sigma-70 family RNA polymerase sigma factor [Phycisphaerales bacterium]
MDEWQTNRAAIASAIAGDREALRAVWADHRRWVAAILLAHKSREADLEDLLQTVALQLCRKVDEVRDPDAFRPWLRMVAVNTARAEGRSRSRARQGFLRLVGRTSPEQTWSDPIDDEGRADRAEHGRRLLDLARTLPDGYREPLLMRCVGGMSYRQIGAAMDLPETTVETRIARGRRMLRELASSETEQARPGALAGEA